MSKRDSSSTSHTGSFERPTTKKSKTNPSEDVPMECEEASQIAGSSGIYPKASRELPGKHPAPSNRNQRPFRENPGPSKTNPRASNSPRPSFLCPEPNAWPSPHRPQTELSYVNPSTSRSHRPKTHRSRADSRRVSISPLIADVSQLNLNDPPEPEGAEKSDELNVKRPESSSSTEREQKSKCLDWTGSRM